MNLVRDTSVSLVQGLIDALGDSNGVDVAVCPPSVYLHDVGAALRGSSVGLGAQNMNSNPDGAYTGEVSAGMLVDLGCTYVILGHSERRQFLPSLGLKRTEETLELTEGRQSL